MAVLKMHGMDLKANYSTFNTINFRKEEEKETRLLLIIQRNLTWRHRR
jgi:hypothetical protein